MSNPVSDFPTLDGKRILLIISGGIAAYKCLDLIRRHTVVDQCVTQAIGALERSVARVLVARLGEALDSHALLALLELFGQPD